MAQDSDIEVVHVKLPKALIKQVDHIAVDEDIYRQTAIAKLLAFAVAEARKLGTIPVPGVA